MVLSVSYFYKIMMAFAEGPPQQSDPASRLAPSHFLSDASSARSLSKMPLRRANTRCGSMQGKQRFLASTITNKRLRPCETFGIATWVNGEQPSLQERDSCSLLVTYLL
ncbi:hypothetical protein DPSP01_001401 [Paraphaeosphaeria sporulosa]